MFKYVLFSSLTFSSLFGGDIIPSKFISTEFALDIAKEALTECRNNGYQVSAVVVDRAGNLQVALRDVYASRFTTEIAQRKANTVIGYFSTNRVKVPWFLEIA